MSERSDRIHNIAEANFLTVKHMRGYCERAAFSSISSLSEPKSVLNVIHMMVDGILHFPQNIEIRGVTLDMLDSDIRQSLIYGIRTNGLLGFKNWYDQHIAGQVNPEIMNKIIDRNMDHFVENWYKHNDNSFPEPKWDQMDKAETHVLNGGQEAVYGLYANMFNGLQLAAMEQFLEDTAPPEFPFFDQHTGYLN